MYSAFCRISKQSAHRFGGFGLGERCDVGVCVEREACGVVTEHPRDRFDVYSVLQSQGCKCVTERMGGDVRQTVPLAELTKPICHAIRVHRLSVILCEHKAPHSSGITANEE